MHTNPAPDIVWNPVNNGSFSISTGAGYLPSIPSRLQFGFFSIARFVPDSLVSTPVLEPVEIDKHPTGMRKKASFGPFFFCKMAVSNEFFSFPDLTTMTGASSCFKLVKGNRLEVLMPGWDWIWSSVSQIALRFFFSDFSRCLGFL